MNYSGTIVEESLIDSRILNKCKVIDFRITGDDDPQSRWHLFTVEIPESLIEELSRNIKPEKWYAHFWNGDNVIAVFPGKIFTFQHSQKETWTDAVEYGKSLGIPEEQLDFVIT